MVRRMLEAKQVRIAESRFLDDSFLLQVDLNWKDRIRFLLLGKKALITVNKANILGR